ncbi:hypothetical protein CAEBREN_07934 [Caenorhabditis brenneri]|uniref:Uncharacterized protein n=1 Tax=Caenorhabditis brenneri TaxID=135651 RepID=G0PF57_CAEBE|nr:hypothetical protein CAEBREN_07934 [Caenorhabditis brenneri]
MGKKLTLFLIFHSLYRQFFVLIFKFTTFSAKNKDEQWKCKFQHEDQGLIRQQGYRSGHLEQLQCHTPTGASHRQAHQDLILGWDDQGQQAHHQQDQGGLNVGNPHFANLDFQQQPIMAQGFAHEEVVPYKPFPRVEVEPVADISTHSKEDQELMMNNFNFSVVYILILFARSQINSM